jgi:pyruvate kinase
MISKFRPRVKIYAFSHTGPVCNRLNLFWGVHPVQRRELSRTAEDMVNTAERELLHRGELKAGDVLGVVAGTQMASGSTNFMRLHTVLPPGAENSGKRAKRRSKEAARK